MLARPVPLDGPQGMRAALSTKTDVNNGTLNAPNIDGGTLDGKQTVGNVGTATRTLSNHFLDIANPLDFGAAPGAADSATSLLAAYSSSGVPIINIPFSQSGYNVGTLTGSSNLINSSGQLLNWNLGISFLNGSRFSGTGIGAPETGGGAFNSTYTNPWNVTTNLKMEFDPAALPQKNKVTNQALSIECRPNRPNGNDQTPTRHWIACVYRGADTGSGGASGTQINTEVDNDVLNLDTNSGTAYEIDVNVNGAVADGGISRGIFVTGGGIAGNAFNSVALDIQHGTYSGTGSLNWGAGVSVRNSLKAFMAFAESDNQGSLYQGYNSSGTQVFNVDTNGYVTTPGIISSGTTLASTAGKIAFSATAENADDYVAIKASPSDSGFFFRAFDTNGDTLSSVDKNGYAVMKGLQLTGGYTPTASTTCSKGTIMNDDSYLYVCTSAGAFKKVALGAL
ncbi:hypothetical protein AD928_09050 [Acetobacter cerevisiae]|uniref:Uncharacterized protein n=2 Tax=Acetobacter cerevisiae TaxID=178900 RepID=A0A149Q7T0_9PROT|nr:hypothetical protein AD928_09050 [Acetobacter cerevisiae]GBQ10354.1 hypothetical protein AA14362_2525 [Acetobacter cerevisiae DSM 14362]